MPRPTYPPDYCDREQLAYRLSCAPGYVDQLQRMGRIPPPVEIGPGMVRWRWADVERVIEAGCSTAEVAAITGQSLQMVEHYARARDQRRLAIRAMERWENEG